jgi:hypothetical protein
MEEGNMQKTDLAFEKDLTWMKFADLLVDTGVISDCIENKGIQGKMKGKTIQER